MLKEANGNDLYTSLYIAVNDETRKGVTYVEHEREC